MKVVVDANIVFSGILNTDSKIADVDPKDTPYVAYSQHFDCKIWSGDKKLILGLGKKGFTKFIDTAELLNWRDTMGAM